jgi:O-antigen ligase
MLTYTGRLPGILKNYQAVYSFLCIGITTSLIFWPLLNSIFCALLLLYWLFTPGKKFSFRSVTLKKASLFAAMYLPVVLGCFYSSDITEATFRLQQKSALLIFPIIFASLPVTSSLLKKKIFWTLVLSTALGCLLGLGSGIVNFLESGNADHLYGYSLVVLKDMHPSVFGLCCLLSIGFLFEELRLHGRDLESGMKIGHITLIAFMVLFLSLMGNRNNLICLNLLTVIYLFRAMRSARQKVIAFSVLLFLWLIALNCLPYFSERWKELVSGREAISVSDNATAFPDSKTARLKIWNSVIDVVGKNWLLGVGTGDSQLALERSYKQKKLHFAAYNHCNAHNQYLQEAVAFGFPGLIIFLLCLIFPLAYPFNSKEQSLYMMFLLLFAFVCLSESILQLNKGIVWYSFFNSLLAFGTSDN